ncbi:MAG: type II toxin-antitoxin system YafQ family toxin [Patescibacteria group bacterium]
MIAHFHKRFKKNYKRRIFTNPSLDKHFEERFNLFLKDPSDPTLKDHPLTGNLKGLRAFWVTGDIKAVYYIRGGVIYFVDIGTHNQVYRK